MLQDKLSYVAGLNIAPLHVLGFGLRVALYKLTNFCIS